MDSLSLSVLTSWRALNDEQLAESLAKLNSASVMQFKFGVPTDVRKELSSLISDRCLDDSPSLAPLRCAALETVRILSRDPSGLETLLSDDVIRLTLRSSQLAQLSPAEVGLQELTEATKALVNSLFHSSRVRQLFLELKCDNGLRLRLTSSSPAVISLRYLDLHVAFIISAKERPLQNEWRADISFVSALCGIVREGEETWKDEALKVLFNLLCHAHFKIDDRTTREVTESCLVHILSVPPHPTVFQNCVNLLATTPALADLICPEVPPSSPSSFDGREMKATQAILDDLDAKLSTAEKEKGSDTLAMMGTYFTVLINICVACKQARRYCRLKIIPPLTSADVHRPPETGDTLRNRIIRVMQSVSHTRELAAQFLFVLCKRSVNRLIKYSGLGHAAGLLANSGLLGRINDPPHPSDSEDSETEDYKEVQSEVNPVTGYIRPEKGPNPLEGMTEEQKEYEAMKLVNAMDEMMRLGVVKPGTIGEDGKPREVSHVLELTKDIHGDSNSSDED